MMAGMSAPILVNSPDPPMVTWDVSCRVDPFTWPPTICRSYTPGVRAGSFVIEEKEPFALMVPSASVVIVGVMLDARVTVRR